jgi:hypothetical protein
MDSWEYSRYEVNTQNERGHAKTETSLHFKMPDQLTRLSVWPCAFAGSGAIPKAGRETTGWVEVVL